MKGIDDLRFTIDDFRFTINDYQRRHPESGNLRCAQVYSERDIGLEKNVTKDRHPERSARRKMFGRCTNIHGHGVEGRHPVFYGVHKYGPIDVMSSVTTAAQRELEAPLFTVVESKGLRTVFHGACKYGLLDVISRAAAQRAQLEALV